MSTLGLEIGLGVVGVFALVGIVTAFVGSKKSVPSELSERYSDSYNFRTPEERENAEAWENSRNQAYGESQARNNKILYGSGKRKTKRIKKSKRS